MKFPAITYILLLLLFALILPSCESLGSLGDSGAPGKGKDPPKYTPTKVWKPTGGPVLKTMVDVARLFPGAAISGTTVDFKMGEVNGSKMKHLADEQDEDNPMIRWAIPNIHLKNFYMRDVPGGMGFAAMGCRVTNCIAVDIGEDAISTITVDSSLKVDRSKFYNSDGDKSIQFNSAQKSAVTNSEIHGGITAIRVQKRAFKHKNVEFESRNNTFEDVRTAHNVAGDTHVTASGNTYIKVLQKWLLDTKDASYTEK